MSLQYINRVWETLTVNGTNTTVTLTGTAKDISYRSTTSIPDGEAVYYLLKNPKVPVVNQWETGIGIKVNSTTFIRDTVTDSSNSGALVNFTSTDPIDLICSATADELNLHTDYGMAYAVNNHIYL